MSAAPDLRRAGRLVFWSGVALLVVWVLFPIWLLMVNALSAPGEVTGFPKRLWPSFDTGSLAFFFGFQGVLRALWNSVQVAAVTMVLAIGLGAPAGYALSRFDFPGKEAFRFLVIMTRAFPLPLLALPLAVMFIRTGLDDTILGLALVHTTLALPFAVLITFSLDKKGKKTKGAAGQIYRLMAQQPPSEEARTITTKGGPFTLRLPDAKLSPANLAIGEPKKDDKGRDTVEWKIIAPKSTEPGFVIFEINEFTNPYMHVTSEPPTGG